MGRFWDLLACSGQGKPCCPPSTGPVLNHTWGVPEIVANRLWFYIPHALPEDADDGAKTTLSEWENKRLSFLTLTSVLNPPWNLKQRWVLIWGYHLCNVIKMLFGLQKELKDRLCFPHLFTFPTPQLISPPLTGRQDKGCMFYFVTMSEWNFN